MLKYYAKSGADWKEKIKKDDDEELQYVSITIPEGQLMPGVPCFWSER